MENNILLAPKVFLPGHYPSYPFLSPIDHFAPVGCQNSGRPSRTHENHFVPFLGPPYNKSVVLALLNMISENPRVNFKINRCVVECI